MVQGGLQVMEAVLITFFNIKGTFHSEFSAQDQSTSLTMWKY